MIHPKDIGWLAALLDGEGHFNLNGGCSPRFTVAMYDSDLIERVCRLTGGVHRSRTNRLGKKVHYTDLSGAPAIEWCMTLYTLMGRRRKATIQGLITIWKEAPGKGWRLGKGA